MDANDRELQAVARETAAKTDRDYPRPKLRPGKVLAVDTDQSSSLLYVTVLLAGDKATNGTVCVSLVGEPFVGQTVMVLWEPPQQFFVIGFLSRCVPRIELLHFSAAAELSAGDVSAPGRVEADATLLEVIIDTSAGPVTDALFTLTNAGGVSVNVPLASGLTTNSITMSPEVDLDYEDMPLYATCVNAGGGGWGSVTITCVLRMECTEVGTPASPPS